MSKEDKARRGIDGLTRRLIDSGTKPSKARERAREIARKRDRKSN